MKFQFNKKYNTLTVYIIIIIAISLLMVVTLFKFDKFLMILQRIITVLMPVIWGFIIAYLLNPIMKSLERFMQRLFKTDKFKKLRRAISVTISMLFLLAGLSALIYFVVPQIYRSINMLIQKFPDYVASTQTWFDSFLEGNPTLKEFVSGQFAYISKYVEGYINDLEPMLNDFVSDFTAGAFRFLLGIKDFLLGFIVSIYLLASKEKLLTQLKKVMISLFQKKTCERVFKVYHKSNGMFSGFISGKIIDSLIIGIICFMIMSICKMPYAVLISVIICVTNIIPFFGPFIGAIPSAFLIILANPNLLLPFLIIVVVLQLFDGYFLGPKILGESTQLPAFWVLFSILVGGGLFGFVGMILGVPTFAVIYAFFRSFIETRLDEKNLPKETSAYYGNIENYMIPKRAKDIKPNDDKSDE